MLKVGEQYQNSKFKKRHLLGDRLPTVVGILHSLHRSNGAIHQRRQCAWLFLHHCRRIRTIIREGRARAMRLSIGLWSVHWVVLEY